jgi:hypothetical protein
MMESGPSAINAYAGPGIHPREKRFLENLAAYLIGSSFSQQRMESSVRYYRAYANSTRGRERKREADDEELTFVGYGNASNST